MCDSEEVIIGQDNDLAPNRRQVVVWTKDDLPVVQWSMCAALGGDELTHWGWVTHICVSDLTSIGSDNGLSAGRRQAIIRTDAGILLLRPLGTNFSEFLVEILIFSFKKMCLKVTSAKRRPFCLGLNELIDEKNTYISPSWISNKVCLLWVKKSSNGATQH